MSDANWTDRVAAWGAVKKVNWKGVLVPIVAFLIVGTFAFMRMTDKPSADKVAEKTLEQGAPLIGAGIVDALTAKGLVTPPATTPKPSPNYDYLTCTHLPPKDLGCVPLFPQKLTTEATFLIGYEGGDATGALNTDNTRNIADQIRRLAGTNQCDLYLGLVEDKHKILAHKVFASQAEATTGSVKLYDCTPKSAETPVTAPTS